MSSDWSLSLADFERFMNSADGRAALGRLIGEWLGYVVVGDTETATVQSTIGQEIDLVTIHAWIQRDPEKSYALNQAASTLWR
jgi:hypothetical protein